MIKVNLKLISEFLPSKEEEIEITLAEIIELAKEKIKNHPSIGLVYKNNIKRIVVIKQITVYYRVVENKIFILTYFDTRQNPDKLSKLLF